MKTILFETPGEFLDDERASKDSKPRRRPEHAVGAALHGELRIRERMAG